MGKALVLAGTSLVGMGLVGCSSGPPQGTGSGRVEPGWSTPAEAGDARVLPDDLVGFSDDWAQSFMRDLPEVPRLRPRPERTTIVFGDIDNKTDYMSSEEFEFVRKRMTDNLIRSRTFGENYRVLINKRQLEELRAREVDNPNVGQRIDPANTFLLNGTMFRTGRGDTHLYYFNFELVSFTDGEIVWVDTFEGNRYGR